MKLAAALFALIFLGGCAVYQPPNLPPEQLATLSFEWKGGAITTGSVALSKIDGQAPTEITWVWRSRKPISVAPGKHSLDLTYVALEYSGKTSLWFVARPGVSYIVRGDAVAYKFMLWVEEVSSGLRVGGIKGSSDEPRD